MYLIFLIWRKIREFPRPRRAAIYLYPCATKRRTHADLTDIADVDAQAGPGVAPQACHPKVRIVTP